MPFVFGIRAFTCLTQVDDRGCKNLTGTRLVIRSPGNGHFTSNFNIHNICTHTHTDICVCLCISRFHKLFTLNNSNNNGTQMGILSEVNPKRTTVDTGPK